jgi:hypothetical protein
MRGVYTGKNLSKGAAGKAGPNADSGKRWLRQRQYRRTLSKTVRSQALFLLLPLFEHPLVQLHMQRLDANHSDCSALTRFSVHPARLGSNWVPVLARLAVRPPTSLSDDAVS